VVEPSNGDIYVMGPVQSELRRKLRLGYTYDAYTESYIGETSPFLIDGGIRGRGAVPTHVDVYVQSSGSAVKKSAAVTGGTLGYLRLPVWTSWESGADNGTETDAFVAQVAADITAWSNCGGQNCFVGPPAGNTVYVKGYDDFISIQILEVERDRHVFRTRVYELPPIFLPVVILAGETGELDCGGSSRGGAGDSILFEIVDVECDGDSGICVYVDWSHYSGSCTEEPPGVDPYTGLIKVYDRCIFSYYTVDFLLTGGAGEGNPPIPVLGRATYWYEDGGYCEGKWIVDSICGTPECG
jgi:hypothetical protein